MDNLAVEAFQRITRMRLPVYDDDLLLELDPGTLLRVPQVLDRLSRCDELAPQWLNLALGLKPGSTFRQAVRAYRGMAPRPPQPKDVAHHKRQRSLERVRLMTR